jgi:hypothetical protein
VQVGLVETNNLIGQMMKTLIAVALLSTLAAPVLATERPVLSDVVTSSDAVAVPSTDAVGRRSGRCFSREGSPCGGV